MALYCRFCGTEKFRPSHFRFRLSELRRLLVLYFPVRCLTCDERSFAPLHHYLKLRNEYKMRQHQQPRGAA